jgi:hypothetical protein
VDTADLVAVAEAYFGGLRTKDMSRVPWHERVSFRGPLAPGYPEPIQGRQAVESWFSGLYPVLGEVRVIEHYINTARTEIATRAEVAITNPKGILRVLDRFVVDSDGRITEQENYYDPRPALPQSP